MKQDFYNKIWSRESRYNSFYRGKAGPPKNGTLMIQASSLLVQRIKKLVPGSSSINEGNCRV